MALTPRKALFLTGFVALPLVTHLAAVQPALDTRSEAIERQRNAGQIQQENQARIRQARELEELWGRFKPQADEGMEGMEEYLNPVLIQKRVTELARVVGCDVRIQQDTRGEHEFVAHYNLTGSGTWPDVVHMIDQLERGHYRVRFDSVTVMLPEDLESDARVTVNASFMIPDIPVRSRREDRQ